MQEFFMDYGLWLLIALLAIIGIIFLLSGRRGRTDDDASGDNMTPFPPEQDIMVAAPTDATVAETSASPAPLSGIVDPVVPEPEAAVTAPDVDQPDDLLRLKGVGPKLNGVLIGLGIRRFAQIASWTDADIVAIDARLGAFKGRAVRDQWVDQARYLAAGDVAGFEAKYGKL